jgi:hypothetical protein
MLQRGFLPSTSGEKTTPPSWWRQQVLCNISTIYRTKSQKTVILMFTTMTTHAQLIHLWFSKSNVLPFAWIFMKYHALNTKMKFAFSSEHVHVMFLQNNFWCYLTCKNKRKTHLTLNYNEMSSITNINNFRLYLYCVYTVQYGMYYWNTVRT